jgi:hypothetical protein
MVDLNGHEAGNGGHPKENLQPIGTPLLGETRCFNISNDAGRVKGLGVVFS